MASIAVNINAINSIRSNLNAVSTGAVRSKGCVSQARSRLDYKIAARRSISYRLNRLEDDVASILKRINNFGNFIDHSMDTYANAELSIIKQAVDLGILDGSALSSVKYERQVEEQAKEKGFWENLKTGASSVMVKAGNVVSKFFSLLDNPYVKTTLAVISLIGVVGILAAPASAFAAGVAVLCAVHAFNDIWNSGHDILFNVDKSKYGEYDGLKSLMGTVGSYATPSNPELGKKVSEFVFDGSKILTMATGLWNATKNVRGSLTNVKLAKDLKTSKLIQSIGNSKLVTSKMSKMKNINEGILSSLKDVKNYADGLKTKLSSLKVYSLEISNLDGTNPRVICDWNLFTIPEVISNYNDVVSPFNEWVIKKFSKPHPIS